MKVNKLKGGIKRMSEKELQESNELAKPNLERYNNIKKSEYAQTRFSCEITDTGAYFYDNNTRIFDGDMYQLLCEFQQEITKLKSINNRLEEENKDLQLNCLISQNCMNILATIIEKTLTEKLQEKETIESLKEMFEELSDLADKLEEYQNEQGKK